MEEAILHHEEGVDLIPANIELSALEISMVKVMSRETILRQLIAIIVLINKMWMRLGILALIYAAMMIVLFAAAEVQVWIDVATDLLKEV